MELVGRPEIVGVTPPPTAPEIADAPYDTMIGDAE
jgi:hypothetical protein